MPKLQPPKKIKFKLESQDFEIQLTKLSAYKVPAFSKQWSEIENLPGGEKEERIVKLYAELIKECSDLENTVEEISELLSMDEMEEIASLIMGTKTKEENFTKTQA